MRYWKDRALAFDPGLNQVGLAARATLAVASALALETAYAGVTGTQQVVALIVGAIVAMLASFGGSMYPQPRGRTITLAGFPVALLCGLGPAMVVGSHRIAELVVFVVVLFFAVYVRRFGPRFFLYGMLAWIGYFFGMFLALTVDMLPGVIGAAVLSVGWSLVLGLVLLPERPARRLRRTLWAFEIRTRDLAAAQLEVLRSGGWDEEALARQHGRAVRLNEAALIIEGRLDDQAALAPGWSAASLRRSLFDTELAATEIGAAATALVRHTDVPSALVRGAADVLGALAAGDLVEAEILARRPVGVGEGAHASPEARALVRHMSASVIDLVEALQSWWVLGADPPLEPGTPEFEPAVPLFGGNLPGSASTANELAATDGLSMTTRQAIQVAVAGALAIGAGELLSQQRYYWAVIAAFIAFTGTSTTGETLVKGANRVVGTMLGLVAAVAVVRVTGTNLPAVLAVSLGCIFVGFALQRVSYAITIFFITVMVGELYELLGQYSNQLLVLRLEETLVGAFCGALAALVVLPLRTSAAADGARRGFLAAIADVVQAATLPGHDDEAVALTRAVDGRLHQLLLITRPAGGAGLLGLSRPHVHRRSGAFTAIAWYARRLAYRVDDLRTLPEDELKCLGDDLAAGARALGARHEGVSAQRLASARRRCDALALAVAEEDNDGSAAAARAVHQLERIGEALERLAVDATAQSRSSGAVPDPASGPRPAVRTTGSLIRGK